MQFRHFTMTSFGITTLFSGGTHQAQNQLKWTGLHLQLPEPSLHSDSNKGKIKVKFALEQATKAQGGGEV